MMTGATSSVISRGHSVGLSRNDINGFFSGQNGTPIVKVLIAREKYEIFIHNIGANNFADRMLYVAADPRGSQ